jgi:hypothetical protein
MENKHSFMDSQDSKVSTDTPTMKRPHSVTILALGVLIITVTNLMRFGLSLKDWSFLASQPGVSPLYLAISGFLWAVAGGCLVVGLWRAKTWAPRLMQAIALTYALYYWLDLIFLKDHPVSVKAGALQAILPVSWQFSAGVTVVCLAYMAWTLGRKKVKTFFGLDHAEHGQNQADDEPGMTNSLDASE